MTVSGYYQWLRLIGAKIVSANAIILLREGASDLKQIEVKVIDNDLEKAMRVLKKKIQNDGLFKRLKLKKSYEKPSEYRRRKQREALRRQRIAAAKARARRRY
jgi:small subunit ribosomal protein S21